MRNKMTDDYYIGVKVGVDLAWDAAKKIVLSREDGGLFDYDTRKAWFGCGNYMALKIYSASKAIEKIRQYEQEQEVIEFGDEIEFNDGEKALVIDVSGEELSVMTKRGFTHLSNWRGNVIKTGVKCVMIAEYLKKMHEEK